MKITEYVEMTDETRTLDDGTVVYRIRAIKDIPRRGITTGEIGGWVQKPENLHDQAWVDGAAVVRDDAQLYHYSLIGDAVVVRDKATMLNSATASGTALIHGAASIYDRAAVHRQAKVGGKARLHDTAHVSGYAEISGNAHLLGRVQVYDSARVDGWATLREYAQIGRHAHITDNAVIGGTAKINGTVRIGGNLKVLDPVCLNCSGDLTCSEDLITGTVLTSIPMRHTAWRHTQIDGTLVLYGEVGCWHGTADELLNMVESDTWVETPPFEIPTHRPELLAVAHQWQARQNLLRSRAETTQEQE